MTVMRNKDNIASMAEKDLLTITTEASKLLDYYGILLSDRQNEALTFYYNEDLSLAEISEIMNISRQAVHEQIKNGVKSLVSFEEKLSLVKKHESLEELVNKLELAMEKQGNAVGEMLKKIKELI